MAKRILKMDEDDYYRLKGAIRLGIVENYNVSNDLQVFGRKFLKKY